MPLSKFRYFTRFYYKINLYSVLGGSLVGIVICAFESAITERWVSLERFTIYQVFSILMTLCVCNLIYVYECSRRNKKRSLWMFILIYNVGLIAGTELSYLVLAVLFHVPYNFKTHFSDYRLSLLIGLVLAMAIYFYRAQQAAMNARLKAKELDLVKIKQLKTAAELQTLQSKINPHFLYNSLNSIAALVHENADKAEDMTLKLSRLFRYSINSPQGNMATVTDEMEIVNTYLDIEKVRFGDRLTFSIRVDARVEDRLIPRFLIQPLVENALKHGLSDLPDGGELNVSLDKDGENILIVIADNGKPFPDELDMGYGLQSTYDKLTLLYGENYQVQISNAPQKQIRLLVPAAI